MKAFLRSICFIASLLLGTCVMAQVKFFCIASPNPVGRNDYTTVEFTLLNATGYPSVSLPSLNDFIIISGPDQASRTVTGTNGNSSMQSISFSLRPKRTGRIRIGSATAVVNGKVYETEPVILRVTNNSTGNNSVNNFSNPFIVVDQFPGAQSEISYKDFIINTGEDLTDKIKRNLFLRTEVNKTSCYVGEPIIATYKLYSRLNSDGNITQNPSFNGFSVIDLQAPGISTYTRESLKGKEYNVYIIRKAQIYPLQPGKLELEPAEVESEISFLKQEYVKQVGGISDELISRFANNAIPAEGIVKQKSVVRSESLFINIKALPDANKPASFNGAVGDFTIKSGLEKNTFTTDDAGKLYLAISGQGNMQLITGPEIKWPQGIESFEGKTTDDFVKTTVPINGTKFFEYPFTVPSAGQHTIPPIEFSFFDPASETYKTVVTKPISFNVSKGNGRPSDSVTANQPAREKFFNRLFSNRWMVITPIILLVILGLFFWIRSENRKEAAYQKQKKLNEELQEEQERLSASLMAAQADPLEPVKACLEKNDSKGFYNCMNDCFKHFLSNKLNVPFEELNRKNISERLDKHGFSTSLSIDVQQLLDEIEWQLYTPFSEVDKMQLIYERADELIQRINLSKGG